MVAATLPISVTNTDLISAPTLEEREKERERVARIVPDNPVHFHRPWWSKS